MNTQSQPITGEETIRPGDAVEPLACLKIFYAAFNQRNIVQMANNWSQQEQASMSNPLGDIKRGWPAIRTVYKRIFGGPAKVYVEFYDYSLHITTDMFCAVGRERGYVEIADRRIDLAIRTTRIYHKENDRWKHFHHQGSIDNAELLARYQSAIKTLSACLSD